MDGKEARIAAKRAREQEEAEEAAAYERLKQELADRRRVAPPAHAAADPRDAAESEEEEEEEEESNLQLDALDDFCRGPGGALPRDVHAMAFNGPRVRVMTGDLTDADATSIAVGRIKVLAQEGFGPGDKEGVCRDIWARLQSLEGELRATLDETGSGEG